MDFPLKSLGAFVAGFGLVTLLCAFLKAFVFGLYNQDVGPVLDFVIQLIASLVLFIPAASLSFAYAAYAVNSEQDPWRRSLFGGALLAMILFAVSTVRMESLLLTHLLFWSTLLLGAAIVGAWARHSVRAA